MDLWIRSQTGRSLIKCDNLRIEKHTKKDEYSIMCGLEVLGIYKGYTRALTILGDIQSKLKGLLVFENCQLATSAEDMERAISAIRKCGAVQLCDYSKDLKASIKYCPMDIVYEMPKE